MCRAVLGDQGQREGGGGPACSISAWCVGVVDWSVEVGVACRRVVGRGAKVQLRATELDYEAELFF